MALGNGFFSRLFGKNKEEDDFFTEYAIEMDEESESLAWSWDNLIKDRHLLKLSDDLQREKYIRSLVEQVKNASEQIDRLSVEYNTVTGKLQDMDEIENLPGGELASLRGTAEKIIEVEKERNEYFRSKNLMSDAQFKSMQQFANEMPKAYEDLKAAEEHRTLIRDDLKKLDDEKLGYVYRNSELRNSVNNLRGMLMICMFAAIACILMLLVLQFGFNMDTRIGFIITTLAIAIAVTVIYVKYTDDDRERIKTAKAINRIILLQNTVKIRYVNNKNLLDYLYNKYNTESAKELLKVYNLYEEEREKRDKHAENEKKLNTYQQEMLRFLKRYHLSDVYMWLHNPLAIMDHKEMVEVRHSHILRRQKLRAQLDYNKKLAKEAQSELKQLIKEYPRYAGEVMDMLDRYS